MSKSFEIKFETDRGKRDFNLIFPRPLNNQSPRLCRKKAESGFFIKGLYSCSLYLSI